MSLLSSGGEKRFASAEISGGMLRRHCFGESRFAPFCMFAQSSTESVGEAVEAVLVPAGQRC